MCREFPRLVSSMPISMMVQWPSLSRLLITPLFFRKAVPSSFLAFDKSPAPAQLVGFDWVANFVPILSLNVPKQGHKIFFIQSLAPPLLLFFASLSPSGCWREWTWADYEMKGLGGTGERKDGFCCGCCLVC